MNIYKIRQRLDEIERLRVTQPSALQSQEGINEAIAYQASKIQAELKTKSKTTLSSSLLNALKGAQDEIEQAQVSHA